MTRVRHDLNPISIKVEPDVETALRDWAAGQGLTVSEAGRLLLRQALEGEGAELVARDLKDVGFLSGRREGLRAFHEAAAAMLNRFKEKK